MGFMRRGSLFDAGLDNRLEPRLEIGVLDLRFEV
jgi:hypothetical protein